jgi:hypothetical protein
MRNLPAIVMLALFLMLTAGCGTSKQLMNVGPVAVKAGEADLARSIKGALANRGWKVIGTSRNVIKAELRVRRHMARIAIPYGKRQFSIKYLHSRNLSYRKGRGGNATIHRNYNRWVRNLEKDILMAIHAP